MADGINELESRLEICYNKILGSVCHNSWSTYDAYVVCKQLGHQPTGKYCHKAIVLYFLCIKGATALNNSYFGQGQASHVLTNVECSSDGNYNSLIQCSYNTLNGIKDCGDGAVASVICVGNTISIYTC